MRWRAPASSEANTVAATHEDWSEDSSRTDRRVTEALSRYSQGVTRRSFLTRAASVLLASVGGSLFLETAAFGHPPGFMRTEGGFNPAADWHHCTDWDRCFMCGYSCNCCNGGGNNPGQCPDCANSANHWQGCCTNPSGVRKRVRYTDCKRHNCGNAKLRECYDCSGCNNACGHFEHGQFWKANVHTYVCTRVNVIGDC